MQLLITVGTTEFDALMRAIDTQDFAMTLAAQEFSSVVIQMGRGSCVPTTLQRNCEERGIAVRIFDFTADLVVEMRTSDVVMGHCGAGTILEAVACKKPLIVVINASLQDNHQLELAQALSDGAYQCVIATVDTVTGAFEALQRQTQRQTESSFPILSASPAFASLLQRIFSAS